MRRLVAAVTSVAVTVGLGFVVIGPQSAAAAGPADSSTQSSDVTSRPDSVSAQVTARAEGHAVVDESQSTAYSTVSANPDGSWTESASPTPIQAQAADGSWVPIDTALSTTKSGELAPVTVASDVAFSNGGDTAAATMTVAGQKVSWLWPTTLPTPTVSGSTATYQVGSTEQLVLTATATGFSEDVVLTAPPTSADQAAITLPIQTGTTTLDTTNTTEVSVTTGDTSLGAPASAAPSTSGGSDSSPSPSPLDSATPAPTSGADPSATASAEAPTSTATASSTTDSSSASDTSASNSSSGVVSSSGLVLKTGPGKAVLWAAPPMAYDATAAASADGPAGPAAPAGPSAADVPADSDASPLDVAVSPGSGTRTRLTLRPDWSWLTAPSTTYPVTIDPTFTSADNGDTWFDSQYPNSDFDGGASLSVGDNAGAYAARTLLRFSRNAITDLAGKDIVSASLHLQNYSANSCTAASIRAYRITSSWSETAATWNNQPSISSDFTSNSAAHGYSSACPAADAAWDVTSFVTGWAAGSYTNYGIELRAANESNTDTFRAYRATEANMPNLEPRITVTYDDPPNKATAVISTPAASNPGYSTSTTPTLTATVSDPDKGNVRADYVIKQGSTQVWAGDSAYVTSGGKATVTVPAGKLASGQTYTLTTTADDGTEVSAPTSQTFTVDTTGPSAPTVTTSTGFSNGAWLNTYPSSNTFTLSSSADTASFAVTMNGTKVTTGAPTNGAITVSGVKTKDGQNELLVTPTDKAGNVGATTRFYFGTGDPSFIDLDTGTQSTGVFPIDAAGPGGANRVEFQWRYASSSDASWQDLTGITSTDGAWSNNSVGNVSAAADGTSQTAGLSWDATSQPINAGGDDYITGPALLELRTCFYFPNVTQPDCSDDSGAAQQLQVVPSAFGGNFPTTDVGPATVALYTGEMTYSETDAVDSAAGVGRTFTTLDPATVGTGAFGPGWSTSIVSDGSTDAALVDNRAIDHTFVLEVPGGGYETFTPADAGVDPNTATGSVAFKPVGTDTDDRLTLNGNTVTLTNQSPGSNTTTWTYDSDLDVWGSPVVTDPTGASVAVASGSDGYPTFIAQTNEGSSVGTCTLATQDPGCRGLEFHYTGTGIDKRVTSVDRITYGADPVTVATYTYDTNGLLSAAYGPDPDGNGPEQALATQYTYDTTTVAHRTLLKTVTPPGQATWTFDYDSKGRLVNVTRPIDTSDNTGSGDATWTVRYNASLSMTDPALPDLSAATAAQWGQTDIPTRVTAVFDPSAPDTDDLTNASLWYTDPIGNTTNTAVHGNISGGSGDGTWLVDTDWYDEYGNVVQSLDADGRARVLAADPADQAHVASDASSFTDYSPDGTRVEDEYGPVHTATLKDGTVGDYRTHTAYTYDDQAPSLGGADKPPYDTDKGQTSFDLVVQQDTSASDPGMTSDYDTQSVRYLYNPLVTGDGNGWDLGLPTSQQILKADGTWATTQTIRYDTDGNQIETRQFAGATNADGSAADAQTTDTSYYTQNNTDPDCTITGHPERAGWDDLACKTGPAGQPSGAPIPVTWNKTYDTELEPTLTVETSGSTTRTTTNTYDAAGRVTSTTTEDGTDTRTQTPVYDPATGEQVGVAGTGASTSATLDDWGNTKSYVDGSGHVTSYTYDPAQEVASQTDLNGVTTYSYDQAPGEHRDTASSMSITPAGSTTPSTWTFADLNDQSGDQSQTIYPNGMTATTSYDTAGDATDLDYTAPDGTPLLSFSNALDVNGIVQDSATPESDTAYTYDAFGRLTTAQDTSDGACQTRTYGFDDASNRTSKTVYGAASDGTCQTDTPATSQAWTYDTANRTTNSGYVYDNLGRATSVPAADTTAAGDPNASPLSISYYANDMAKSLTQTVSSPSGTAETNSVAYTLDATGRINGLTDSTNEAQTSQTTYVFGDDSDSPSAVSTSTDGGLTWSTTGYLSVPGAGMAASLANGTLTYQLSNLHGDAVAQMSDPTGTTIDSYTETDEYGAPVGDTPTGRYGYLGTAQRSTDTLGGLVLMGARLYNAVTGSFLSPDSVLGGNNTPYSYPEDPINGQDASGDVSLGGVLKAVGHAVGTGAKAIAHVVKKIAHWLPGWVKSGLTAVAAQALNVAIKAVCAATGAVDVLCTAVSGAIVGFAKYTLKHVPNHTWHKGRAIAAATTGALNAIGSQYLKRAITDFPLFGKVMAKIQGKWGSLVDKIPGSAARTWFRNQSANIFIDIEASLRGVG